MGLLILGVYNTSYNYMSIIGTEVRRGYVKYLLVLPVSRGGITVGRVLAGTIQGIVYVAILLGVTLVFLPWPSFAGFLMIFGTVACLSFCLSSLGIAIASYLRPALVDPVSDVLGLSLLFTSTIYYPPNIMPLQLKFLTAGNLLTAGADLVRAGFGLATISNSDVITLSLWTITFALLSIRGYYRQLEHLSLI